MQGSCVVHLGEKRHGADDITSGERRNLIIWNTSEEIITDFPPNCHSVTTKFQPHDENRSQVYRTSKDYKSMALYQQAPMRVALRLPASR
jgi:hypothetical protein